MELNGAKILYTIHTDIPLLGDLKITQTLVTTWIVMALLSGLAIWLGSNLKLENVSKRQAAAEFIVERLDQFVHDNMGYHFDKYIPLIGSIFALSIGCNLISVIGLWSPTADLNTEAAWAIVVFVLIMYYKIKTNGILSYLKGLLDPIFIMAPINVLSEISTPVSMAFRHFGNILSGTVISTLLYWALASLSHVIFGWLPGFLSQIQLFQIGIPAFTGLYFDWFGGCIQAFIFCTLTTIFIMAPINVLSEVSTPVSMAFRHFGNILSGTVISTLLYWALASLSHVIFGWLPGALSQIQLFQIGIPAFTGLYFDWFGGCIQAFIFCTLTAIFIKRAAGED